MADDVAQVLTMEVDGVKLVFKASLEVAAFLARALRALIRSSSKMMAESKENRAEKKLNSGGEKYVTDIYKLSEGNPPQVLEIREADFDLVTKMASEKGMHFAKTSDFISNDGLRPILIPAHEAVVWSEIYKSVSGLRLEADRKIVSGYDKHINEEMEKLLNCKNDAEREQTETRIENLQQAKSEAGKWVDYDEGVASKEDNTKRSRITFVSPKALILPRIRRLLWRSTKKVLNLVQRLVRKKVCSRSEIATMFLKVNICFMFPTQEQLLPVILELIRIRELHIAVMQ